MKSLELYIGDDKMELREDTIVALTRQVNNLGELKDRQTDFTNTFTIPKSNHNQNILESLDNINSISDKPYQKEAYKIIRGGIEIVRKGLGIIESVKDNYEIYILSGNANFFEEIKDKKLVDLSDLDVNTIWHRSGIAAAIGATSGIFWPILNRGVFDNTEWADCRSLWPAIYVHNIIDYILSEAGFNKAGDYLDSDDYKKLVLPYVSIKANDLVRGKMAAWRLVLYKAFIVLPNNEYDFYIDWDSANKYDPYTLIKPLYDGFDNIYRYFCPSDGFYKLEARLAFYITDDHGYIDIHLMNRKGKFLDSHRIDPGPLGCHDFTLEYEDYLNANDTIYVWLNVLSDEHAYEIQLDSSTTKIIVFNVDCELTAFECEVPCGINLPDITQKELLKSLAWMHCLLFITDNFTKTVHFIKFSDVIKNKRIAYDWSDKLDSSKDREPELKFKFGIYGQNNYLRYKEDEVKLDIGDDYFVFDDETLSAKKTLIEMPFAATEKNECLDGIVCAIIKCQEINKKHILDSDDINIGGYHSFDGINWIITGLYEKGLEFWYYRGNQYGVNAKFDQPVITKQPSQRILAIKKDDFTIKLHEGNKSDTYTVSENINIAYFTHPTYGSISFNRLIDDHYQEFINTMNKPKVLTAYFKLFPIDILQFNFAIPVWIDHYQSYFYVNKIEEYQGEITKVELIKI